MAAKKEQQGPPLGRRVINLAKAVTRHVRDGGQKVSDITYQRRLEICRSCASCDLGRMVCLEMNCGCKLARKARWRSEVCPLNRWPSSSDDCVSGGERHEETENSIAMHPP
ncbi:hypothetical protein [Gimesia aquarii]|uniref:Uncharacterized protein n=1 Tax=Gimesia aquarii TaxID=2527964 RepID=A0A517WX36_9PLAN|nr:hypothetical protein [Gimesia aquarii]QDU09836.1 hypothetical protein V202x_32330 [Gimesia aquarii]